RHPQEPHTPVPPLPFDIELRERGDQPVLEITNKSTHVALALLEIQHDVADALARTMIGELSAAPALVDRKACIQQIGCFGARAGGVDRRVFDEAREGGWWGKWGCSPPRPPKTK